ncbi:MAG TPA: hypothetical protein DD729_10430 [Rhodobacteraceae bacterium]|jgi:two-component system phosphate regulon sensor histidine kinase PhoR|nr:hypothetical protein [Paracoccaceae bacterium]
MGVIKHIIDGVSVPVIAVRGDLTLAAANAVAFEEFPELDDVGGFARFLDKTKGLHDLLGEALEEQDSTKAKVKARNGFRRDYTVTIQSIGDFEGSQILLLTFEDESIQKDIKSMRTGFVANVSHEIRSPLTAISGFVETLQGPAIENVEARERFLGLMAKEVKRMTNLVTDLLSLSQVEAKERRSLKKVVMPDMVIHQAIEAVTAMALKSGKTLLVDIATDLPKVKGRQDDLVRVLINLLENAISYSREKGQVRLSASVNSGENPLGTDAICIAVSDDGEGIAAEEIPLLTQRFYRVDKSRSRNLGGTGLGLAIVKHVLVRHRGKLVVESSLGEGSVFSVYLPIAENSSQS